MKFEELNLANRKAFDRAVKKPTVEMAWEDESFLELLLADEPNIRETKYDNLLIEEIKSLKKAMADLFSHTIDEKDSLEQVKKCLSLIVNKESRWYGITYEEVVGFLNAHKACLIFGEGGIGKSFFIRSLEGKLEKEEKPHLCLYGKFEKSISRVDVEEIEEILNSQDFILLIDAFNEMDMEGQKGIIDIINRLSFHSRFRVILTFRTYSIDAVTKKELWSHFKYVHRFRGVTYDSALSYIQTLGINEVEIYHDVLTWNNPLIISKAVVGIKSLVKKKDRVKGITSITTIYEAYVKEILDRSGWQFVKDVAALMYEKNRKSLSYSEVKEKLGDIDGFLNDAQQHGIVGQYYSGEDRNIYFTDDSISDFLIARRLMEDLDRKDIVSVIEIINKKIDGLYGISEAVIICLFDKYGDDYDSIFKIIKNSAILDDIEVDGMYSALLKVQYKPEMICEIQNHFKSMSLEDAFEFFAGSVNKPFNCTFYLNDVLFNNVSNDIIELNAILSKGYRVDALIGRLQNLIYCISLETFSSAILEESLYFGLWCSLAPHHTIRTLAMKLLYEVVYRRRDYCKVLEKYHNSVNDDYMREVIVAICCFFPEYSASFLNKLIADEEYVYSNSLARLAKSIASPQGYIDWHKQKYYCRDENAYISKDMNALLMQIDITEKGVPGFRYWSQTNIDECEHFLDVDKTLIQECNAALREKYSCVENGDCSGDTYFERKIKQEIGYDSFKRYHIPSFLMAYEKVLTEVCENYNVLLKPTTKDEPNFYYPFKNSAMRKCIDIAKNRIYGSMMCNYYVDGFGTFNNTQNNIGVEVYDPLAYGEDVSLASPVPIYNAGIEHLDDKAVSRINEDVIHDLEWVKDIKRTRDNLLKLLLPIKYKNEEWVLLAGRIRFSEYDKYDAKWIELYNILFCLDKEKTLRPSEDNRFLTIEVDDYEGRMDQYRYETNKPDLCKRVKEICRIDNTILKETNLILPPAQMISILELEYSAKDATWKDKQGNTVIYCNSSTSSYYRDNMVGSIYIKKDVMDWLSEMFKAKHFAFSEKLVPETGYEHTTAKHFEIVNGRIEKEFYNYHNYEEDVDSSKCDVCQYGFL